MIPQHSPRPLRIYPFLRHPPPILISALAGGGLGLIAASLLYAYLHPHADNRQSQPIPSPPQPVIDKPSPPAQYTQPVAVFRVITSLSQSLDFYITRPDGSRVVGTNGREPIVKNTKFLGYSNILLPNWLPGQPYKPDDLRLSGGMAGGHPALNMAGRYTLQVGVYKESNKSIEYSYEIICKTQACNGAVLYSHKGVAHSGAPQDAGSFVLTKP